MSFAIPPQALGGAQTISLQPPGNQQTVAFIELNNLCPFALQIGLPSDTRYLMPGVSATYGYPASNTPLVITALGGSNQQGQFSGVWLYNDDPMPMNVTSSGVTTPASTIVIPQTQTQTALPPSYFSTNINTGEAPYAEETTTIVEMDTSGYNAVLVNITPNGASSDYPAFPPLSYVFQWKLSQYLNGNLIASNSAFGFPFDATGLSTYYQPTGPNYQDVIPIFGNSISLSLYNSQAATSGQPMPYNIVLQLLNTNQPTSSLLTFARKISMAGQIEITAETNYNYPSWVVPFTKRQCTLMISTLINNITFSISGTTFSNPLIGVYPHNINVTTGSALTTELSMINDIWNIFIYNATSGDTYVSILANFVL